MYSSESSADGRRWLLGDVFSLADIALAPRHAMYPLIGVEDFDDRYPRIAGWMARVAERPSWEASLILPQPGEKSVRVNPSQMA